MLMQFIQLRLFFGYFYILTNDCNYGVKNKTDCREVKQDVTKFAFLFRLFNFLGPVC